MANTVPVSNTNLSSSVTPGVVTKPEFNARVLDQSDLPQATLPQTVLILVVLALLGTTVYLVFQHWQRKHRRRISTVHKLEGYRYSRLNQTELEVDSSLVYSRSEEETQCCKPATLQVQTDSLTNISNCTTSSETCSQNDHTKLVTLDEASDEDLLQ